MADELPGVIREVQVVGGDLTEEQLRQSMEEAFAGRVLTLYLPPPPPQFPDLVLRKIKAKPVAGNRVGIEAVVENAGAKASPRYDADVTVSLFQNGVTVASASFSEDFQELRPGEVATNQFSTSVQLATLEQGADVFVTVAVDPDITTGGQIRESNEANNHKMKACRILGSMPGTMSLSGY